MTDDDVHGESPVLTSDMLPGGDHDRYRHGQDLMSVHARVHNAVALANGRVSMAAGSHMAGIVNMTSHSVVALYRALAECASPSQADRERMLRAIGLLEQMPAAFAAGLLAGRAP